jgi:hypothetical protein
LVWQHTIEQSQPVIGLSKQVIEQQVKQYKSLRTDWAKI